MSRVPEPYEEPPVPVQRTGMDAFFGNANIVLLIFFALCCNAFFFLPLILGIVGLITCKDPRAKQNALVVTIISGIVIAVGIIVRIVSAVAQH